MEEMKFTSDDFNSPCMLAGGLVGIIIQINSQIKPFDVAVQVPGEPGSRIIPWEKFKRVGPVIMQVES